MFVEIFYGLLSNSLGLLTDGAHMLLDCSAIIIGLYSRFITTKNKNEKYNFGYHRSEVIGTFVNSVFLVFISLYIVFESVERSIEPKHIHGENLILVSFLGLLVNLVGVYFFHGEHGFHTHTGCNISHAHNHIISDNECLDNKNISCLNDCKGEEGRLNEENLKTQNFDYENGNLNNKHKMHKCGGNEGKEHNHSQIQISSHNEGNFFKINVFLEINENLYAIYIHILADAFGSISVLISSFLIKYYGLTFTDPLCSIMISILILYSTWPILVSSSKTLLHFLPKKFEEKKNKLDKKVIFFE